ncbi:hypothetical protein [Sphingomonas sp. Leaf62]|uniref:hypothetical protein n=1 Tax=Sphingomonas sp. Leaf62 TaxID=1736228 RepID=UPI000700519D|nr:hypothetical protein [Sphingomonas sp. Leaf62]KQN71868.1 hypothetical protein ASE91_03965 [Sphingomonas sp. Leaf62]
MFAPVPMLTALLAGPVVGAPAPPVAWAATAEDDDRLRVVHEEKAPTPVSADTVSVRLSGSGLRIDPRELLQQRRASTRARTSVEIKCPSAIGDTVARIPYRLARQTYGNARLIADVNGVSGIAVATDPYGDGILIVRVPGERIGADGILSIDLLLQAECFDWCVVAAEVEDVTLAIHRSKAVPKDCKESSPPAPRRTGTVAAKPVSRRVARAVPPPAARVSRTAPPKVKPALPPVPARSPVATPSATATLPPVALTYDLGPATSAFRGKWRARVQAAIIPINAFDAEPTTDASSTEARSDMRFYLPLRAKAALGDRKTRVTLIWSVRKQKLADGHVELTVNGLTAHKVIRASSGSAVAQRLSLFVPAVAVRADDRLSIEASVRARRGTTGSVNVVSVDALEIEVLR